MYSILRMVGDTPEKSVNINHTRHTQVDGLEGSVPRGGLKPA